MKGKSKSGSIQAWHSAAIAGEGGIVGLSSQRPLLSRTMCRMAIMQHVHSLSLMKIEYKSATSNRSTALLQDIAARGRLFVRTYPTRPNMALAGHRHTSLPDSSFVDLSTTTELFLETNISVMC